MTAPMTRDELIEMMRAWGWTLTGSLPNGRADLWAHPGGMDEVVLPSDETAPDYDRMLRQAESTIARAEGVRLLAVVREVAGLHQPCRTECLNPSHEADCEAKICKTCDHIWPCPTGRALQALTESKERNHEV